MNPLQIDGLINLKNWDEKLVLHQTPEEKSVIHGFVMNVSHFSLQEREEIKKHLNDRGVKITERQATVSTDNTKAGDLSFRVSDPRSIFNLYTNVWQFALRGNDLRAYAESEPKSFNGRPIIEPYAEYIERQNALEKESRRKEEDQLARKMVEQILENPEKRAQLLNFLASMENKEEQKTDSLKMSAILKAHQGNGA